MEQQYIAMIVLGIVGLVAAVALYFVAKRFAVKEDPRIGQVEEILPGANCGACGFKGCHDFATECCKASSLDGLMCPGAGAEGMARIAALLNLTVEAQTPKKAILRCQGTKCNRLTARNLSTISSCRSAKMLAVPANYCTWGCLGCGDCISACHYDAMTWDYENSMPIINLDKCVGCGACATTCPQGIISIREIRSQQPIVGVLCSNRDKGGEARKACKTACIGCSKCQRTCPNGAITITDFLASIDPAKCLGCGECIAVCPTGAIQQIGAIQQL